LAKRVRGQRSTHRPGGVGPARIDRDPSAIRRTVTTPGAAPAASLVTDADAGPTAARRSAAGPTAIAARDTRTRTRLKAGGLEQKAAAEAAWVTEDLRRIAVISAIMLAGLALAWVVFVLVGLGDFY
jgi:hypothetical protein